MGVQVPSAALKKEWFTLWAVFFSGKKGLEPERAESRGTAFRGKRAVCERDPADAAADVKSLQPHQKKNGSRCGPFFFG